LVARISRTILDSKTSTIEKFQTYKSQSNVILIIVFSPFYSDAPLFGVLRGMEIGSNGRAWAKMAFDQH
jgi:hypothetical protein